MLTALSGCGDAVDARHAPDEKLHERNSPLQESWILHITLSESGLKRGSIEAKHGTEYKTKRGNEQHLDGGITVTLFDRNGIAATTITAEHAVIHDNQDVEATGKVVVKSENGTVITTEKVTRNAKEKMIRSESFVTMTRAGEQIRGEGFESDESLKRYRIFRASGEAFIQ